MQQLALILLESAAVPKVGAHSKALHWKKEAKAMNLKVSTVTHGAEELSMLHFWRIKQHREVLCFAGGAWVLYGGSL